jgi:hypothetical protein
MVCSGQTWNMSGIITLYHNLTIQACVTINRYFRARSSSVDCNSQAFSLCFERSSCASLSKKLFNESAITQLSQKPHLLVEQHGRSYCP